MKALAVLAIWTLSSVPFALFVGRFMGAHECSGEMQAREFSDSLGVGGGADLPFHSSGVDDA